MTWYEARKKKPVNTLIMARVLGLPDGPSVGKEKHP